VSRGEIAAAKEDRMKAAILWLGLVCCGVLLETSPSFAATMSFSVYSAPSAGSNNTAHTVAT
jgi:hypothetical protein